MAFDIGAFDQPFVLIRGFVSIVMQVAHIMPQSSVA